MDIDINKKYETIEGKDVIIYTTEHVGDYPVVGRVNNTLYRWTINGRRYLDTTSPYDIQEVSKWKDFKNGDHVITWDADGSNRKLKRIFSHVDHKGRPCAFNNGGNGWTDSCGTTTWEFCIKKEDYDPEIHGELY